MKAHNLAMPVYLMRLHDLLLTVVEHEGERYVLLRPVVDMLRLSWKRVRARAMEAENMRLYDIQLLTPLPTNVFFAEGLEAVLAENEAVAPAESGQTGGVLPLERGKNAAIQEENFTLKRVKTAAQEAGKKGDGEVYINIHRVYLYIARVSTSNVRAKSDDETVDRILLLQQEWGKALHDYEQYGIAVKGGQHMSLKELFAMRKCATTEEKARLTYLITLALYAMGCPSLEPFQPSPQNELFGDEA